MNGLVICLFILTCFATPIYATPISWAGNGHSYEVVQDVYSWNNARIAATQRSYLGQPGYLATMNSPEENLWVSTTFSQAAFCHWIGANYSYSTMRQSWYWASGEPWSFANWNIGEPGVLNGIENAVSFTPITNEYGFTWWDMNGSQAQIGYVVEYNVPEPSSILLLVIGSFSIFYRKPKSPTGLFLFI